MPIVRRPAAQTASTRFIPSAARARALRSARPRRRRPGRWCRSGPRPPPGCMLIASFSSRRRRSVASASAPSPGRSSVRRPARSASSAVRKIFTSAWGHDRADVAALHDGVPLVGDRALALAEHRPDVLVAGERRDDAVDLAVRISLVTSRAVDRDRAGLDRVDGVLVREGRQRASSSRLIPRSSASQVSARYIAPVST